VREAGKHSGERGGARGLIQSVEMRVSPSVERAVHGAEHEGVRARVEPVERDDMGRRAGEARQVAEDAGFCVEDFFRAGRGGDFDGVERQYVYVGFRLRSRRHGVWRDGAIRGQWQARRREIHVAPRAGSDGRSAALTIGLDGVVRHKVWEREEFGAAWAGGFIEGGPAGE
jgi:hypothetical protein